MNPELLAVVAELERLEKAASPAPWRAWNRQTHLGEKNARNYASWALTVGAADHIYADGDRSYDLELCAALRNHLPTLLSAVRAMGEELREVKEGLRTIQANCGCCEDSGPCANCRRAAALLAGEERVQ